MFKHTEILILYQGGSILYVDALVENTKLIPTWVKESQP